MDSSRLDLDASGSATGAATPDEALLPPPPLATAGGGGGGGGGAATSGGGGGGGGGAPGAAPGGMMAGTPLGPCGAGRAGRLLGWAATTLGSSGMWAPGRDGAIDASRSELNMMSSAIPKETKIYV